MNVSFNEIILFGCLVELKFIFSVLLILSFNLLYLYHFSIFINVFLIKFISSILLSDVKVIAVSSVYTVNFRLLSSTYNGRSLTYMMNSKGPSMEPWGTPISLVIISDSVILTLTSLVLLCK